jgi:hypothetical protein
VYGRVDTSRSAATPPPDSAARWLSRVQSRARAIVRGAVTKRTVKHGMSDVERVRAALDGAYKANALRLSAYSPKMVWNGARAATMTVTVMTRTITTDFTITDDEVLVEGKIPFAFRHLEGRIMTVLGEQLVTWFAKTRGDKG